MIDMKVIGLLGRDGGALRPLVDCAIIVPALETYEIQELHLPIYHALCATVEEVFFGPNPIETRTVTAK